MSNEYLRKSVADRRTGANLIGINVDTSNMNNLSPDFEMAFNQLEAFAKESDNLKIQNEKTRLKLEIAKNRLDFKEKYLSDPTIYSSQEKWDMVTKLYEEERQKAKKIIADSKYLSADEKSFYGKDLDIDFKKDWLDPMNKRNGAVMQERVDEATILFETAINNACYDDLYKTDTIENFIKQAGEIYNPLINLGIATKGDKNKAIVKGMAQIEGTRLSRKLEKDILTNSLLTEEQKQNEIKKVIETLNSDKRINNIVENMTKEYGYDNYEKEYLKSSLKAQYENASIDFKRKLENIKIIEENEKKEKRKEIEDAVYKKDVHRLLYLTKDKNVSTSDLLNKKELVDELVIGNYSIKEFGNIYNGSAFPFLSAGIDSEIKSLINAKSKNGNYTYSEIYSPLYETADKLAGTGGEAPLKRNAIIIDFGLRNGIDPNILILGEKNPDIFRVANSMSIGQQISRDIIFDIDKIKLDKNERKRFNDIVNEFSGDEILGKRLATQFLLGYISKNGSMERFTESPEYELGKILTKDNMKTLINDAKTTSKLTNSRVDYHYVNIKDPRIKDDLKIKKQENEKENISEQTEALGG